MYTCKTQCFFRDRRFDVGEKLEGEITEKERKAVDKFFTTEAPVIKKAKEPKTLKEVQDTQVKGFADKAFS